MESEHQNEITANDNEMSEAELDADLREKGTSLRCVTREIPPVFGSFFTTAGRR